MSFLSIVIPVLNEDESILPLVEEIADLQTAYPHMEVVLIDDGSSDQTWQRIEEAVNRYPFVRGFRMERHQGKTAALLAGLSKTRGDMIVTMDGDLQNNPSDIPRLLEALEACDAVCGYRAHRHSNWSRRVASRVANRVRNLATHDGVQDTACGLKAFRRKCIGDLPPLEGVHRFIPSYFRLYGRSILEIPVDDRPRRYGQSKYINLKRLPGALADLFGFLWFRRRLRFPRTFESTPESS